MTREIDTPQGSAARLKEHRYWRTQPVISSHLALLSRSPLVLLPGDGLLFPPRALLLSITPLRKITRLEGGPHMSENIPYPPFALQQYLRPPLRDHLHCYCTAQKTVTRAGKQDKRAIGRKGEPRREKDRRGVRNQAR